MKIIAVILAMAFSIYTIFFKEEGPAPKSYISKSSDFESDVADVRIVGLNDFKQSDLIEVKNSIQRVLKLRCEISDPVETDYMQKIFVTEEAQRELGNTVRFEYDEDEPITVFVTSSDIYSYGLDVRGICYGNQIYIQPSKFTHNAKKTAIHEILHSKGLEHCENDCIMNSSSMNTWNDSTDEPIYCSSCRALIQK